jgi:hypothetical protein
MSSAPLHRVYSPRTDEGRLALAADQKAQQPERSLERPLDDRALVEGRTAVICGRQECR